MASTKTKRTRATKSSSKSVRSNKKGLFSKINFRSKKVQFLTVILSFAIIGGGFSVYKSFAATHSWTTPGSNLYNSRGNSACTESKINDSSKNNTIVASLACPSTYNPSAHDVGALATYSREVNSGSTPRVMYGKYRACANVKGGGRFEVVVWSAANNNKITSGESQFYNASGSYQAYCSPYRVAASGPESGLKILGSVSIDSPNTWINISSITIEREITTANGGGGK